LLVEGKELRAVATDGHRLAFASVEIEGDLPRQEMILPRKTVLELNRLLVDSDEPLGVTVAQNQVRFSFGSVVLVSKLIDGKFPDYERVVPATLKIIMSPGRPADADAGDEPCGDSDQREISRRAGVLGDNSLKLIAANAEQEEAQEEIEVAYNGDAIDVGFNVGYLLDVLNNVHTDEIQWSFNDANSSALITVPGNDRFKYVVMPMRI
jgi:DNA polymerase-3 subunit beta